MMTRSRSGHHRVIIRFPSGSLRMEPERAQREAGNDNLPGSSLPSLGSVTIRRLAPFRPHRLSFRRGGTAGGSGTTVQIGSVEIWEFGSKLLPLVTPSPTVSGRREHPLFPTAVIHSCLRPASEQFFSLGPPDRVHCRRIRNKQIRPRAKLTAQPQSAS
jgi:hypothetical protein